MPIKIRNMTIISAYQIEEIIKYYNQCRPFDTEPLEQYKNGGGFIIAVKSGKSYHMPDNQKYKMLRWHKNVLVTYIDHAGFSEEEEELLYISFIYVLGEEYVKRFNSYSSAFMSSPSYFELIAEVEKRVQLTH